MIQLALIGCLTALAAAVILGVTVILIAVVVYFVVATIRALVSAYQATKKSTEAVTTHTHKN